MSYLALYRKYRPQTFDEVVGQDSITRILKNQIKFNRVGHAYLFSGIRGTGKTSLAKIFAKAINCPNGRDGNPCNTCEVCLKIDRSGVMDIIEIDGASNRGVDEIREIREKIKYPPTIGRYKVYIIDEVHMLTKEAFNALLKTLEEPPEHAVFILATTEPNKCPTTILSRCQRYEIRPIPKVLIIGQMKKICVDLGVTMSEESFDFIASRGENSMRDALSLLDQIIDLKDQNDAVSFEDLLAFTGMADKKNIYKLVTNMISGDSSGVLLCLRELVSLGKDSSLLMDQLIEYLRGILITKTANETAKEILLCTPEDFIAYEELGKKLTFAKLYKMISELIDEKNKLKYSSLQAIIVEMALLKLCLEEDVIYPNTCTEIKQPRHKKDIILPDKVSDRENTGKVEAKQIIQSKIEHFLIEEPHFEILIQNEEQCPQEIDKFGAGEDAAEELEETLDFNQKIQNPNESLIEEKPRKKSSATKHDEMKLFKILCDEIGKTNSGQAMFLKRGEPSLKDEDCLVIVFSTENKNYFHFINKPETIKTFEVVLTQVTGKKVSVSVALEEENFNELDILEKTRRIVNNDAVKIINYDGINEK